MAGRDGACPPASSCGSALAALTGDIDIERTAGCVSVELTTDNQFQLNDHPRAAVQAVRLAGGIVLWMEQGQEGDGEGAL